MRDGILAKYEKGCDVTVVEMLPYIMSGACTANRYHLIHYMERPVSGFTSEGYRVYRERVQIEKHIKRRTGPIQYLAAPAPENIANPLAKRSARRGR